MSFESFKLPEEGQREEKILPKKKSVLKSVLRGVLAAGALAVASGVALNEATKEDREQDRYEQEISDARSHERERKLKEQDRREQEISATLSDSHKESPEQEKMAKDMYNYFLHNYHVRLDTRGRGGYINDNDEKYESYARDMNNTCTYLWEKIPVDNINMEEKARALEIAINSGIVDPETTGWFYLWNRIKFDYSKSAPYKIHFGKTIIPFNKDIYSRDELDCLE